MDGPGFDDLVRRAGDSARPRRAMLRLLAGAGAAAVGLRGGAAGAGACRLVRETCSKQRRCCGGARCFRSRCECKPGFGDCDVDGRCDSLLTDPNNCGRCTRVCPSGACLHGSCTCNPGVCPEGCGLCPLRRQGGRICAANDPVQCAVNRLCQNDDDCPPGSGCATVACGDDVVNFCTTPC